MTSTTDIINKIGADEVQRLCEVGEFSIRAAKRDGQFPASWFDAIDRACADRGIHCPRKLFAFKKASAVGKGVHPSTHAHAPTTIQGGE